MAVALEWAGVSKRYGRREALRELSLAVPEGAAVGLLGPNGAGKTTALQVALGLVRPGGGGVRLRGADPREPAARRRVGYLPERPAAPPHASLRRFLRHQATLAGIPRAERDAAVARVLGTTGLAERAHDRVRGLSRGLAQRAGFAAALLGEPALLLLDEPTSGLDPLGVRDARDWLSAARARGATLVVSSHVLSEVERLCDRVAIVHEGRVAASGRLDEIVAPGESLEDAFVRVVRG